MKRSRISLKLRVPVWKAFRRHCHRFLAIGYQQALTQIRNGPDEETDITGYLREAIDDWFLTNQQESTGFYVRDDNYIKGGGRTGKRRLRTDLVIGFAAGERPEFIFEAKRLHRTKALASNYTGKKGMGCFLNGNYAAHCHEVGMIGYVQTDTLEHWKGALRIILEKDSSAFKIERIEKLVSFEDSFPLEWSTFHQREALDAVKMFHILLDCRKADTSVEIETPTKKTGKAKSRRAAIGLTSK